MRIFALALLMIGLVCTQQPQVFARDIGQDYAHAMPLSRKIIVVDAGHGGWDPGMVSGKVHEKDINLEIAKKLQVFLEQGGATVIVTRLEDEALANRKVGDMQARRLIANTSKADIFVSIHQNSYKSANVKGFQVFYFNESDNSKKLAVCIQDRMKEFVNPGNKHSSRANKNYYVLKETVMPAVLVECGFLTNSGERGMLGTGEYQEKIAWGIYLGIVDYFHLPQATPLPEVTPTPEACVKPEQEIGDSPLGLNR